MKENNYNETIKELTGYTMFDLEFNFTLQELKAFAKELKIKNYYKMNKGELAITIDIKVNGL